MEITRVILAPVISEKSINITAANKYTFYVAKTASKKEIAKAVGKKFNVDVLDVKVINIRGKKVRFGKNRIAGKRKDKRKAVVTIRAEQRIDIFDLVQEWIKYKIQS